MLSLAALSLGHGILMAVNIWGYHAVGGPETPFEKLFVGFAKIICGLLLLSGLLPIVHACFVT